MITWLSGIKNKNLFLYVLKLFKTTIIINK